jgi:CheY-like chemotaxis protein
MNETSFRLLLVENDPALTALLEQLLPKEFAPRRCEVIVKRYMDEARTVLQDGGINNFSGLMIDIMLPRTEKELAQLVTLETERRELLRQVKRLRSMATSNAEEQVSRLYQEIDGKDSAIEEVQDLQGGITLLNEIIINPFKKITIPTVFSTARALPDLRKRAQEMVEPGRFAWIQKPAAAGLVVDALSEMSQHD